VANEGFAMSQDPNVWWSKEIGKDLNKGMRQAFVDSREAWRKKTLRSVERPC